MPVLVLPPVPKDPSDDLIEWFVESDGVFKALKEVMVSVYLERVERLNGMAKQAGEVFWWPFTQHKLVAEETVTVIDSRCGENFSVYKVCMMRRFFSYVVSIVISKLVALWFQISEFAASNGTCDFHHFQASDNNSITQQFDACASWWTQGPDPAFQVICAYS